MNNNYVNSLVLDDILTGLELYRLKYNDEPDRTFFCDSKDLSVEDFPKFAKKLSNEICEILDHNGIRYAISIHKSYDNITYQFYYKAESNVKGVNVKYKFVFEMKRVHYSNSPSYSFCCNNEFLKTDIGKFLEDFIISELDKSDVIHSSKIYIIYKGDYGLNLKPFKIKSFDKSSKIKFEDLYNDDFIEVSKRIEEHLSNDSNSISRNGITLLQGDVGTGKTSYLRHLIRNLNKKVIYLPPDLSPEISSPVFISFLMEHPDSILVIEDAETILKTREAGGNQAVSNILNMSDGILGDALSIQIICTFNAPIDDIDKALLREGRLIEIYNFGPLSEDKTKNLFTKVYGSGEPPKKKMTLAQIFNKEQHVRNLANHKEKPKFGFV